MWNPIIPVVGTVIFYPKRNARPGVPGELSLSLSVSLGSERHSGQIATDCYMTVSSPLYSFV